MQSETCKPAPAPNKKTVYIIKQWNLPATTVTRGFKEKYVQEKNISAIYQDLVDKIKKKKFDLVVAEGCEGEINSEFSQTFNGWDLETLKKESHLKNYDRVITNIPLKIEARFGDKIHAICGDSLKQIQEGNVRVSNLRGWMGFWERLKNSPKESGHDENLKLYAEAAADLLKISRTTPLAEIRKQIQAQIKSELESFKVSLTERGGAFAKVLHDQDFTNAAVIVSGIQASNVKSKIEEAGMDCVVLTPPGYSTSEENLLRDFEKAIQ